MTAQASVAHVNSSHSDKSGHNRSNLLKSIGNFFASIQRANASLHYFEQLSTLSDSQLDQRGISREDLPKLAFERYFGTVG